MSNHGPTSISLLVGETFSWSKVMHFAFPSRLQNGEHQTVNFLHSEHETRRMICFFSIILNFGYKHFSTIYLRLRPWVPVFTSWSLCKRKGGHKGQGSWRSWWYTWFCKHLTEGSYAIHILSQPDGIAVISYNLGVANRGSRGSEHIQFCDVLMH